MTTQCDVEEQVRLELQRLDSLFDPHFRRGVTGDVRATLVCLKVMERRARLLGLDAPARHQVVAVEPTGGVLVVPGIMEEAQWLAAAEAQQAALQRREAEIWQRPPARRRRVASDD